MKFKEIELKNFGPIREGVIHKKKVNVFFGPNNSGKSMVSKLIYGIGSLDVEQKRFLVSSMKNTVKKMTPKMSLEMNARMIIEMAGIRYRDVITHGETSAHISIKSTKAMRLKFNGAGRGQLGDHMSILQLQHLIANTSKNFGQSVYIPAGRTGTMQFFTSIVQIRNKLLSNILNIFDQRERVRPGDISSKEMKRLTHSLGNSPRDLERFSDLILDAQYEGLDINAKQLFSELFEGSIESDNAHGLPTITYTDPTGFITDIESAGSGIISSFPIIVGIYYVKPGGTLIIEEPEAHLEPSKQLEMIDALYAIAQKRKIELVFTTHSDYIVRRLLSLVGTNKIQRHDLGIYYFNRERQGLTNIEKIDVDKMGQAEQPTFQKALDMLVGGSLE